MKINTVKKMGSYLHSYGSPNDVKILTLPLKCKGIFFLSKYWLIICQKNLDLKFFETKLKLAELGPKTCYLLPTNINV